MIDVQITQYVRELLFDIQNRAYIIGQSKLSDSGKTAETVYNIQQSDDIDDNYQVKRSLTSAYSTLLSALSEYLSSNNTKADDIIKPEIEKYGTLIINLSLPDNFDNTSLDSLNDSIHDYLVAKSIGDWFTMTNKEDAEVYLAQSAVYLTKILNAVFKRKRPKKV